MLFFDFDQPQKGTTLRYEHFSLGMLLKTKAFWVTTVILTIISGAFTLHPLTALLGFDYSLFFGVCSTVASSHFTWAAMHNRAASNTGPGYLGTVIRIGFAAQLTLGLPLLVIVLNALRVQNCNFVSGFLFFAVLPGVGTWFGLAIGVVLSLWQRRGWPIAFLYILPVLSIGWAIFQGLSHPPIFAYDHYFGYYPGTIYDEIREITTTLLMFRLRTLMWAVLALSSVGLLAGRGGLLGQQILSWREALLQKVEGSLDGRLRWSQSGEAMAGTCVLLCLAAAFLFTSHLYRHKIGYQQTDRSIQEILGGRYETQHFIIYYDRNHASPLQLRRMERDSEFRYHQLVQFFGHHPRKKTEIYWFANVQQKARLMGAAHTMIARPWAYQFYIHGYDFPHNVLKHEMAHVFSAAFGAGPLRLSVRYGVFFYPALIEGVAVAADWVRGELTPHEWSRAMLDLNIAPSPETILGPQGFFQHSGWLSYTIAGSFSRYLIDTHGIAKYKQAYGRADFEQVYHKSLRQMSQEWKVYLQKNIQLGQHDKQQAAYRFRRFRSIFVRTCPHSIAMMEEEVSQLTSIGAYYSALQLQEQICAFAPRTHQHLRRIDLVLRLKQYARANTLIQAMLKDYPAQDAPVVRVQILRRAGELALLQNQRAEALRYYNQASRLPLSLGEQRQILVMQYALQQEKVANVIMDYLSPKESATAALLALQAEAIRNPQEPMLAYLLGRRLYFSAQYNKALPWLQTALQGLPQLPLQAEILRLQGLCHFYSGQYDLAATLFHKQSRLPLPSGLKREALDNQERARWEQSTYKTAPSKDPLPR